MEADPLPYYFTVTGWNVQFHPSTTTAIAGILLIVILLFMSALISGSEAAYFSLNPSDHQKQGKKKDKYTKLILRNLEDPEKLLATILVASNFINIAVVVLAVCTANLIIDPSEIRVTGYLILVVTIVLLLLFFGKIIPQVYAGRYAIKIARIMAIPLQIMKRIFNPLNTILISLSPGIRKRVQNHTRHISLDDLSEALELTNSDEEYDEKEILEGIVNFGSKNVAEIMRSRHNVVALDLKVPFEKVLHVINESGYSRIPVYSGSFGNIQGILYTKDLLPFIHDQKTFRWQSIIRPPFYVPETKKIDDLLEEFQKNKVHMAITVDKYGGSSGIVTLQDVLEEIVGDILDEFDEEEHESTRLT